MVYACFEALLSHLGDGGGRGAPRQHAYDDATWRVARDATGAALRAHKPSTVSFSCAAALTRVVTHAPPTPAPSS
jgi:hypothetical protein